MSCDVCHCLIVCFKVRVLFIYMIVSYTRTRLNATTVCCTAACYMFRPKGIIIKLWISIKILRESKITNFTLDLCLKEVIPLCY